MIWNPFRWFAARQKAAFDRASVEAQRQLDAYATFVRMSRTNAQTKPAQQPVSSPRVLGAGYSERRASRQDDDSMDTYTAVAPLLFDIDSSPSVDTSSSSDSFSGGGGDFGGGGSSGDW